MRSRVAPSYLSEYKRLPWADMEVTRVVAVKELCLQSSSGTVERQMSPTVQLHVGESEHIVVRWWPEVGDCTLT